MQHNSSYSEAEQVQYEYTDSGVDEFGLMRRKEIGAEWNIICGTRLCSRFTFKTTEDARKYIRSKPYELIATISAIMAEEVINSKKQ